jgi:hypothetical protein
MNLDNKSAYASLAYLVGTILTYNQIIKLMVIASGTKGTSLLVVESIALAAIWPVYWLYHAFYP